MGILYKLSLAIRSDVMSTAIAFCPFVMIVYAFTGAWLIKIAIEKKRQFLFLLAFWALGISVETLIHFIPNLLHCIPRIIFDPKEASKIIDAMSLTLSFGSTICLGWAAVLGLKGKFKFEETGSFVEWIAAIGAICALVYVSDMRATSKALDTLTSVVAIVLMSISLIHAGRYSVPARHLIILRWIGTVFWLAHAVDELSWYIIEINKIYFSDNIIFVINLVGVAPTIAAALITGTVFGGALELRQPTNAPSLAHLISRGRRPLRARAAQTETGHFIRRGDLRFARRKGNDKTSRERRQGGARFG